MWVNLFLNHFVKSLTLGLVSGLSVLAVQAVQAQNIPSSATEPAQVGEGKAISLETSPEIEGTELLPQAPLQTITPHLDTANFIPGLSVSSNSTAKTPTTHVPEVGNLSPVSTQAADLMVQDTSTNDRVVEVTEVNVQSTATGIEIQLAVPATDSLPSSTQVEGNTLITKIENAVLALPGGQPFRQQNPATGITEVTVSQIQPTQIQVRVTGVEAAPVVSLSTGTEGVVLTATPGVREEEETEITVTAEKVEEGYRVPNASTATKTDTPIRDIPQSIQVIPKEVIEDQQVTKLEEALRNVSGITFGGSSEGAGISLGLRGFSDTPILLDGFRQFGLVGLQGTQETANLEGVEVLKGPASILYGEIQPGGVVNLVSKQPLDTPFYGAELQVGSRALFRPRIDFAGPLTKDGDLLYRLNAVFSREDSFRDFDTSSRRVFIAPTLAWKISDRTDLTLQLEYLDYKQPFDTGRVANGDQVLDIPRNRIINEPGDFVTGKILSIGYNFEHRFSDNWKIRNSFRYLSRDIFEEFAFPFDFDPTTGIATRNFGGFDINVDSYSLQTNVVGKFNTGSVKHTLLAGVDLNQTTDDTFAAFDLFNPLPLDVFNPVYGTQPRPNFRDLPAFVNRKITERRLGIFLQDQVEILDHLKLLAGLRYDIIELKTESAANAFDPVGFTASQTDTALTPRLGIVYQPIDAISLYASYSRSFNPSTESSSLPRSF
jgi:iron complex outermembrane receptor protein